MAGEEKGTIWKPEAGEFYRHFKGGLYQVVGTALNSWDGGELVVYQALYGDYRWYARPLAEFTSFVDGQKHPEYAGEYRFRQVVPMIKSGGDVEWMEAGKTANGQPHKKSAFPEADVMIPEETQEQQVRPELLLFLDAESAGEKLKVLRTLRGKIDEELLTNMELSLDLMPDEKESMERRIQLVEMNLEKRVRYEGGRLRN